MRIFKFFTKSALLTLLLFAWSGVVLGQYGGSGTFTKITSEAELVDGFYVIANSTSEEFVMSSTNGGSYFDKSDLTPASGEFVDPAASVVWEITDDGNGNKIVYSHETSQYVAYSGGSNAAYAVDVQNNDESLWTITYDAGGSEFLMESVNVPGRILQYNASQPRFACYGNLGQQKLSLFVMPHTYGIELKDAADALVSTVTFDAVDYGYTAIDAETISITNIGTGEITGLSVASSDASFVVTQPDAPIAATYTSTFTVAPADGLAAGTYTGTITVTADNGVTENFVVSFDVNDTYEMSVDAAALVEFAAAEVGYTPAEETVTISNDGSGELTSITVESSDDAAFEVSALSATSITYSETATFVVAPVADLAAGTYTETITVNAGNADAVNFDVTFTVNDTYEFSIDAAAEVVFTAAEVGYTPVEETVAIENLGSGELTGLAVASSSTDFEVTQPATTLAATYSTTFTVAPAADLTAGTYSETITVTADNELSKSFEVTFTVTDTYEFSIDAAAEVEFAAAEVGYTPVEEAVTIENLGSGELTGLAVASSSTNFVVTQPDATLAATYTTTFTVAPAADLTAGTYSETITVTADNELSKSFEVSFVVTDTYKFSLDAAALVEFATAEVGYTPAEETVTIENTGSGELTGLVVASSSTDFVVTQPATTLAATYTTTFTVVPAEGLAADTYSATIIVTADNELSESFEVSFSVTDTYEIALTDGENAIVSPLEFATVEEGYAAIEGTTVTVENAGTGVVADLAVTSNNAAFEVSALSATSITYSETATFTVNPAEGLTAGTYTATVEVTGANEVSESFVVAFEVTAPSAYMVTFNVADEAGTAIQGATVNVNETVLTTDVDGIASIELGINSYDYTVTAEGYLEYTGTAQVVDQEVDVNVTMIEEEPIVDPINVSVNVDGFNATMTYDIEATDGITESFEAAVPPANWTLDNTNATTWIQSETISFSTGDVVPQDGNYQAYLNWEYSAQDEWLITPSFNVPAGSNLSFWSYSGAIGSTNGDHYYVKVSTDGGNTWTALWDAVESAGEGYEEVVLDLSAYEGQEAMLAWQGVDGDGLGLWFSWIIDYITVGNAKETVSFNGELQFVSKAKSTTSVVADRSFSRDGSVVAVDTKSAKEFVDYTIYLDDMTTPFAENVTENTFEFTDLAIGSYTAGVQKVYTNGTSDIVPVDFEIVDPVVEYEITFGVAEGNGSVTATVDGEAIESGAMVEAGLTVNFTATADAGWEIADWLLNGGSTGLTDAGVELTDLDADAEVMVVFSEVAPVLYNVTFNVSDDNGALLEGATVTFDGTDYTTDADGQVIVSDVVDGSYDYTVSKDGYSTVEEQVVVNGADVEVPVTLNGMEAITVDFNIYPNPTSGNLNIKVQGSYDVTVVNAIGRVIATEQINGNSVIDLSNNATGVYFIRLQSGDKVATKRIILE